MTNVTLTLTLRGIECEVFAEGYIARGGSNRYGSDEPAWIEVEDATLSRVNGGALSKRLTDYIWKEYEDHIMEALLERE